MKKILHALALSLFSYCYAGTWQDHWDKGYEHFCKSQYQSSSSQFDQAILLMSEEEQMLYPYVLIYRAESNYFLHNYERVLEDTQKALNSPNLKESDHLDCRMRRIAVLAKLGNEDASIEEYKKYIIGCPLFHSILGSNVEKECLGEEILDVRTDDEIIEGKIYVSPDQITLLKGIFLDTEKGSTLISQLNCDLGGLFITPEIDFTEDEIMEGKIRISSNKIVLSESGIFLKTEKGIRSIPQLNCDIHGLYVPTSVYKKGIGSSYSE